MTFNPAQHFRSLKGSQYLDIKWRLVWLNEETPRYRIDTELVRYIEAEKKWVCKARIDILDEQGVIVKSATGYGQETEADFPSGPLEKSETKAIGRALALLGFGTQFAMELEEGDSLADSPVTPRSPRQANRSNAEPGEPGEPGARHDADRARRRHADGEAVDPERLRAACEILLVGDEDAYEKLPKPLADQTPEQMEKTSGWLRKRALGREALPEPSPAHIMTIVEETRSERVVEAAQAEALRQHKAGTLDDPTFASIKTHIAGKLADLLAASREGASDAR